MAVNPGVFIDIDGVLLQGGKPFDFSKEAILVKYFKQNFYYFFKKINQKFNKQKNLFFKLIKEFME